MISRRRFLRSSSVLSASAIGLPHIARSADKLHAARGQRPKHIIHLVADGMSMGTFTCADYFSHIIRKRGLTWTELYQSPAARSGWMNMRSLNSMVTDSSAASSSWGSGSRIINGYVNMLPDGTPLKTLYELFGEQGWKRGLVTTTEITHATPAGFAASVDSRDTGTMIAVQYLERKIDVLLGGGQKFFDAKSRRDKRDLKQDFRTAGYRVMETADELNDAGLDQRWLGIFANSHLPYTLDHLADPKLVATVPTLATMTRAALNWLQRHDHFILQVEGGRVDQACHNCDAASAVRDMVAFDEAIDVCLAFQRQHPDTLLVITTDHGNGNMGANGTGSAYGQSSWMFAHLAAMKCSFPEIIRQLKKRAAVEETQEEKKDDDGDEKTDSDEQKSASPSPASSAVATNGVSLTNTNQAAEVKDDGATGERRRSRRRTVIVTPEEAVEIIYATTGYKPSVRRVGLLLPFLQRRGTPLYEAMNNEMAQLGQLIGNRIGIGWTSNAHTADFVPILALGPGAERFAGFIQNVDVFRHYTSLAGIDFKNPEEELIAQVGPDASQVERIEEYALG